MYMYITNNLLASAGLYDQSLFYLYSITKWTFLIFFEAIQTIFTKSISLTLYKEKEKQKQLEIVLQFLNNDDDDDDDDDEK